MAALLSPIAAKVVHVGDLGAAATLKVANNLMFSVINAVTAEALLLAKAAGLDPAQFAGHSLRAGLATSAAMAGAEERDIMRQTRHRSVVVARRYIRDGSLFRNNAADTVGL